jgi:transporter family protein
VDNWIVLTALTLVIWGCWGIFTKLAQIHLDDPKNILVFQAVGTVVVSLVALHLLYYRPQLHVQGVVYGILGGVCAFAGTLTFAAALARGNAAVIFAVTALYPVIGIVFAYFVLKEHISMKQVCGIILALCAVVLLSTAE